MKIKNQTPPPHRTFNESLIGTICLYLYEDSGGDTNVMVDKLGITPMESNQILYKAMMHKLNNL
jgi:hypothetical protein